MEPDPREIETVAAAIRPLLAGHDPTIQGAALADLLALFIAGHHPKLRDGVLETTVELVRKLIPVNVEMMIEAGKAPSDWR